MRAYGQMLERRCGRREKAVEVARKKLSKTQAWLNEHLEQEQALRKRLEQFEQENLIIHNQLKPVSVSMLASAATTTSSC